MSTDNDFGKTNTSPTSDIYSLKDNLIDFGGLISAPEFKPLNEPISIFRTLNDGLELPEIEKKEDGIGQKSRDNLRSVLKKYITEEKKEEEIVQETKSEKIPDIGNERWANWKNRSRKSVI